MFNFPTAKPGDVTAITITSADLEKSLQYYKQLGFAELFRADFPFSWIQISDGALLIMLRRVFPNPPLLFFASDMKAKIEKLKNEGLNYFSESGESSIVLTTPEKQKINLFRLGM